MSDDVDLTRGQTRVGGGIQGDQEQMAIEAEYTGLLRRGRAEGSIEGFLYCSAESIRIEFRGHKDARKGKGYFLMGRRIRLQRELDL